MTKLNLTLEVSDEDADLLDSITSIQVFAGKRLIHRVIAERMGISSDVPIIDHMDNNQLNSRRDNLRGATKSQNSMNSKRQRQNQTGYKGVYMKKGTGRFYAKIKLAGITTYLGMHDTAEGAAIAYDIKAIELFGEFARTNFPKDTYNG